VRDFDGGADVLAREVRHLRHDGLVDGVEDLERLPGRGLDPSSADVRSVVEERRVFELGRSATD
jgi:hypothetical protein